MGDLRLHAGDNPNDWKKNLQDRMDAALVDELAGLTVERVADGGDPAIRIVDFAHTRDVDLIMMPTHGVGVFRSLLVGSVTAKVLHDAKCPVWTAAHAETQTAQETPRSILCAVDGSASTSAIAKWAAEFAHAMGARLHILHVVGPVSDWPLLDSERRLQEEARKQAREKISAMLNSVGIDGDLRVAVGGIVPTVTEDAEQEDADMIIVGRGAIQEPLGRLRTHVFGIVQRSPCPVLSV
jgi:nucleotide-binding universal stress UspA family protein